MRYFNSQSLSSTCRCECKYKQAIMSAIGNKRSRDDINHKYMWHLKLCYIREDRINKLEKDSILDSFNFESYPIYESCL